MGQTDRADVLAMILAGGRGKRMDILSSLRPKPSLPFAGGFRVVDFVLSNCFHSGIGHVAALVDYERSVMEPYLDAWRVSNQGLESLDVLAPGNGSYRGTADAVFQNLDYVSESNSDVVLVLAGDHIYKMDYQPMLDFHKEARADVTVGVTPVPIEQAHRFGIVNANTEGTIVDFIEKPKTPKSDLVSMGIYVFNKDVLCRRLAEDALRSESPHDFGYAIIPEMIRQDTAYDYRFNGYWQDIGTVESYYEASMELIRQRPAYSLDSDWPILTRETSSSTPEISGHGSVKNSIISPGCVIKGQVEGSVLSPGVVVEEKALVAGSVIMANSRVGRHTVVQRCIVDEEVNVGDYCYIGFGKGLLQEDWDITVLGMGVVVPPHTAIGRNCRVLPGVGAEDIPSTVVPSGSIISRRSCQTNKPG